MLILLSLCLTICSRQQLRSHRSMSARRRNRILTLRGLDNLCCCTFWMKGLNLGEGAGGALWPAASRTRASGRVVGAKVFSCEIYGVVPITTIHYTTQAPLPVCDSTLHALLPSLLHHVPARNRCRWRAAITCSLIGLSCLPPCAVACDTPANLCQTVPPRAVRPRALGSGSHIRACSSSPSIYPSSSFLALTSQKLAIHSFLLSVCI